MQQENNKCGVIKEYLDRNGLKQAWFARKIGVTIGMFSTYVTGRVLPSAPMLVKICEASKGKISIDSLVREHAALHPEKCKKRNKKVEAKKEPEDV